MPIRKYSDNERRARYTSSVNPGASRYADGVKQYEDESRLQHPCTAALSFALLFAVPLLARDSTDIIIMKNGDRLTGEVKGLDAGCALREHELHPGHLVA